MCYEEGRLMEYLDGEVTGAQRAEMATHLRGCLDCKRALAALESDKDVAAHALERLEGAQEETAPLASTGASGVAQADVAGPAAVAAAVPVPSRLARIGWPRLVGAAAAVLVAASLTLAPVRGAVADLLQVFRVQKVQVVSMSADDLKRIGEALQKGQGHVDLKAMGDVWIKGAAAKSRSVTPAEAQAAVDFPVRLPSGVKGDPKLTLEPAQTYEFKLHVAAINETLRYYGADKTLPDSLDGKVFTVKTPTILLATYGTSNPQTSADMANPDRGSFDEQAIFVGQARSPEIAVPEGVDAAQLRDVLLNLPFLPQSVRDQLAAVSDWQSTLLVPDIGGTSRQTTIDGVPAVIMNRPQMPRAKALAGNPTAPPVPEWVTIIWTQDGVVRAVGGAMNEETATGMAKSMIK